MKRCLKFFTLIVAIALVQGCGPTDNLDAQGSDPADHRGRSNSNDRMTEAVLAADSCVGYCGGQAPGGCWCDNLCTSYGDCCADYQSACVNPTPTPTPAPTPTPEPTPTPTPAPDPNSCVEYCGGKAPGGCWCDDLCESYGDCCDDKQEACDEPSPTPTPDPTVTPAEAYQLIIQNQGNPNFVILDVRTPSEFAEQHIENATNLDYYDPDFESMLQQLDKNKKYLLYCNTGNRSGNALNLMFELGFTDAVHMEGGITAWIDEGYPVVTGYLPLPQTYSYARQINY